MSTNRSTYAAAICAALWRSYFAAFLGTINAADDATIVSPFHATDCSTYDTTIGRTVVATHLTAFGFAHDAAVKTAVVTTVATANGPAV